MGLLWEVWPAQAYTGQGSSPVWIKVNKVRAIEYNSQQPNTTLKTALHIGREACSEVVVKSRKSGDGLTVCAGACLVPPSGLPAGSLPLPRRFP